ncbi:MAG: efflux RND transporter periplasmic adaptor subunit [Steroidobacteraceae bacterium]
MQAPFTLRHAAILLAIAALSAAARGADRPAAATTDTGHDGSFDCLIEPYRTIVVRSPVTGVIDKLFVARGSPVKLGEPLVSLDSTVETAAADLALFKSQMNGPLKSAESRVLHAESKSVRKTDLAASNYASAQDRDDAEAELAVARADQRAAREAKQLANLEHSYATAQLGLRLIRSPINGVVIDQAMNAGDLAQPGDSNSYILKLAQIDLLRVKVIVPLAYYTRIKIGQRADVVPEKPMQGHYAATVTVVDKVIDAASGTFQVRIDLPNPRSALPGGLRCVVRLW